MFLSMNVLLVDSDGRLDPLLGFIEKEAEYFSWVSLEGFTEKTK